MAPPPCSHVPMSARVRLNQAWSSAAGWALAEGRLRNPWWRFACGNVMSDAGFTELAGPRVALRRFHPGDVATFVAYRSSEQVARFQSWDAPYTREEGERFIREIARDNPGTAGGWFQFAVGLRATGQLIGDCAAMPQAGDPRQCEIGFTIAPDYQGRGYATEAVRLLLDYLFTERGKHRIAACCNPGNAASASTLPGCRSRWQVTSRPPAIGVTRSARSRSKPACPAIASPPAGSLPACSVRELVPGPRDPVMPGAGRTPAWPGTSMQPPRQVADLDGQPGPARSAGTPAIAGTVAASTPP